jgi:hypothetical protein
MMCLALNFPPLCSATADGVCASVSTTVTAGGLCGNMPIAMSICLPAGTNAAAVNEVHAPQPVSIALKSLFGNSIAQLRFDRHASMACDTWIT